MQAKIHPAYEEEKRQLEHTINWIENQNEKLQAEEEQLLKEVSALRKEVSSALDERLLLKQQMQQVVDEDIEKLDKIKDTPYFGRINFQERYKDDIEVIYIGKFGLYDSKKGEMLVLDWRAPMSNIYYSGMDEEVSYKTPKGMVEGHMHLKRRYVLDKGELLEIHDEKSLQDKLKDSIQLDSEFLIESLNKSTKGRLKEIVATIQDQQNKIIRSDANFPLIVQGVAGSGKTTIALHRMAYIIYNRQMDKQAKYMVIAPNKLFLNYIEDILPDLGVENVFQTTFEEWALSILGKKFKLTKAEDKLDMLLTEDAEVTNPMALGAKFRGSIALKKIIDLKLRQIEKNLVPKEHIKYDEMILFTYKEIQQIFLVSNKHLNLNARIKQLGEYLKKRLKDKENLIKRAIENDYRKRIESLKSTVEDIEMVRPQIRELYDQRDEMMKYIKKWILNFVKEYLSQFVLPTVEAFYLDVLHDEQVVDTFLSKYGTKDEITQMIKGFVISEGKGYIETEDLGPLIYSQMKLYGMKNEEKYAHIVVDEAQDLDEMKIAVLREVSANDAFTFVGDLSQGIYDYKGITNWERMMNRVFGNKKYNYYEMTTSYRSTIEIIDLANDVISHCTDFLPLQAQPVLRHGEKPKLIRCSDDTIRLQKIIEDIEGFKEKGMHSICILTECKEVGHAVYKALQKEKVDCQWLGNESSSYKGEVAVIPSYLAKGLEFDAVILFDVSEEKEVLKPVDIKLMYVMVTRALHHLHMYSVGEPLTILAKSPYIE